jgi:hypothetical protein
MIPFVQLEFAGLIGLPEGRYVARDGDEERVLVVQALGAPRAGGRRRKRPRAVDPSAPGEVPVTRVTVAGAERFDSSEAAGRWLESAAGRSEGRAESVKSAVRLVNRALGAMRAAARDPLVQDVGATRALAIRIGFGTGEQLADGTWTEARELPPPHHGRLDDVDPQSRVAAVLSGREPVHAAETLIQRARLDIEQGRPAEARYGLQAAAKALSEIEGPDNGQLREQLDDARRKLDP